MKFVARMFATMAFAFLLASPLWADDAPKRGSTAKKKVSTSEDLTSRRDGQGVPEPFVQAPPFAQAPQTEEANEDDSVSSRPAPPAAEAKPKDFTLLPVRLMPVAQPATGAESPAMSSSRRSATPGQVGAGSSTGRDVITPKVELFLGYSYVRAVKMNLGNRIADLQGGDANIAFNLNRYLGLVGDFAGYHADSLTFNGAGTSRTVDAEGRVFTYMAGPRLSYRRPRFTLFGQVLFGDANARKVTIGGCTGSSVCTPLLSENVFAMALGGGLDVKVHRNIALRIIQAEYLMTRFKDPSSTAGTNGVRNNVRLSAGIVFRFGGNPPPPPAPLNRPPVTSCSIDKTTVYAGSGDFAVVHASASDPDNDPLTYSWTTNGGALEGSGPEVRWNSSGVTAGTYTAKVLVSDGRGGTADCSADIRVEPRPNRPPTMSCSADRNSVLIGEPVQIAATASDPDDDPLTYSWNSSGGEVRGTGASVKFDTAGLQAGRYSVTGHVDDSRGGTADCQLGIEVQEPPPPPRMVELEKRLDLHSIYFPTARPSAANPNGGLVGSQEQILLTLAADFKEYLQFRPEAHLILGGHADERGSQEYNKALTERRVERTRNFLVGHGVPAKAIETRSFGKEDNLSAEQVKEQAAQNPDLTSDDRKQMLDNLRVMVLANNRRVDVSLSTTGQQSTHRYPFNAKDFLALINTKGAEKKRPARKKP
jgi:outer membrane protein OmpA-like peptidoglycan-associated protein/opacity protein-like surface antigen